MTCKEINKYLAEYASGPEEGNLRTEIAEHLKTCNKCSGEYEETLLIIKTAGTLKSEDPGEDFWEGFLPALRKKLENKTPGLFKRIAAPVYVAVLALLSVALLSSPLILTGNTQKRDKLFSAEEKAILSEIEEHYDEYADALYGD